MLARIINNLNIIFSAMAADYEGEVVSIIGPDSCGCTKAQMLAALNANILEFGRVYSGGSGAGVSSIIAGAGISVDQATGDVTVSATGGSGGGNAYATSTNNSGNTTVTPTEPNYSLGLTVGGSARTSILILDTAGRTAGDRIRLDITLPATANIVLEVRNATSGGTLLLPAEIFPSQQFTTDGAVLSAVWDFVFTGTAWRYELSNQPA